MTLEREKIVPYLKMTGRNVWLHSLGGTVHSVRDFAAINKNYLKKNEVALIEAQKPLLSASTPSFEQPLIMSFKKGEHGIPGIRSGARSAYIKDKALKFKGCRPKPGIEFPTWDLKFGSSQAVTHTTGFGTLSAENVMREVLAYCFFTKHGIPLLQEPVCVFEYADGKGYCLVLRTPKDERTEHQLEYYDLTLREVITIKLLEKKFGVHILTGDVTTKGIEQQWYAAQKSNLLISMNFHGGFRGILNSNIGNDIFYENSLYICDFDTFKVIDIPEHPSPTFLKHFCLWCFVELFKTSPLVWDYLDLEGKTEKAVELLQKSFLENSCLGTYYEEQFFTEAKKRGWDAVNEALTEAAHTDVYYQVLSDCVLNSEVLRRSYKPELGIYAVH